MAGILKTSSTRLLGVCALWGILFWGCGASEKVRAVDETVSKEEAEETAPQTPTARVQGTPERDVAVEPDGHAAAKPVTLSQEPPPAVPEDAPPEPEADLSDRMVFTFAGDVAYPNGWRGHKIIDRKKHLLFESVQGIVDSGDLNFVNLECPFTTHEPVVKKTYPITCEPARLNYIVDAGFNLFSLANNHTIDAGPVGMDDTLDLMEETSTPERPVFWGGVGRTREDAREPSKVKLPQKNLSIAFFALATGGRPRLPSLYDKGLMDRIKDAAEGGDFVIVSVHHGPEYVHVPWKHAPRRYRAMISAGASLVVGHHPHVVQGVEKYKDGLIFYSLGNFSFGSYTRRHLETGARLYSMMARVTVDSGVVTRAELIPLYANNSSKWILEGETLAPSHATPQLLRGAFAQTALDEFETFSEGIPGHAGTPFIRIGNRLFVDLGQGGPSASEHPSLLATQMFEEEFSVRAGLTPRPSTEKENRVRNVAGTPSRLVPGTSMGKKAPKKD